MLTMFVDKGRVQDGQITWYYMPAWNCQEVLRSMEDDMEI